MNVENAKGQISRGLGRFANAAPVRAANATSAANGRTRTIEKSTIVLIVSQVRFLLHIRRHHESGGDGRKRPVADICETCIFNRCVSYGSSFVLVALLLAPSTKAVVRRVNIQVYGCTSLRVRLFWRVRPPCRSRGRISQRSIGSTTIRRRFNRVPTTTITIPRGGATRCMPSW